MINVFGEKTKIEEQRERMMTSVTDRVIIRYPKDIITFTKYSVTSEKQQK